MKSNPLRHSSCVGESIHHLMFKVKYCHPIFDIKSVREETEKLFHEAFERYQMRCFGLGFDNNHVHGAVDLCMHSRPSAAKCIKGYVAKKLFQKFPEIKKRYFWNSGLWNPSYYLDTAKDLKNLLRYINKQKYGTAQKSQTTLFMFAS